PNTPRTLAAARKPANEYPSDRRRCRFFDLGIPQHAKIERTSNLKKAPIHKLICRYDPLKSPTRFPEDPKIICIEDDRETAALIAEELNERGFEVTIAHDGQEGLAAILRIKPDLVVSDICMPLMSGFEMLERLI